MGQIQPARRPARTSRRADHQPQHAVAPAAHQLVVALGQQVVHRIYPLRIQLQQRGFAGDITRLHQRHARVACGLRPGSKVICKPRRQRRAATREPGVEQVMLGIHRQVFGRAVALVRVGAAFGERVVTTPPTPRVLLPAGQVTPAGAVRPAAINGAVQHVGQFMDQRRLHRAWQWLAGLYLVQQAAPQGDRIPAGAAMHRVGKLVRPGQGHRGDEARLP